MAKTCPKCTGQLLPQEGAGCMTRTCPDFYKKKKVNPTLVPTPPSLLPTIEVIYSCDLCNLKDRKVVIQARGEESVVAWTNFMAQKLKSDHSHVSPLCQATSLSSVKVPIDQAADHKIGGPVTPKDTIQ